jgi:hypothetical protein
VTLPDASGAPGAAAELLQADPMLMACCGWCAAGLVGWVQGWWQGWWQGWEQQQQQ